SGSPARPPSKSGPPGYRSPAAVRADSRAAAASRRGARPAGPGRPPDRGTTGKAITQWRSGPTWKNSLERLNGDEAAKPGSLHGSQPIPESPPPPIRHNCTAGELSFPSPRAGSLPAQDQVHDPAPPDVLPRLPAVGQDGLVGAAGVFEGVGQDRQVVERPLIVDAASEGGDVLPEPAGFGGNGAERVAEGVAEQAGLSCLFCVFG